MNVKSKGFTFRITIIGTAYLILFVLIQPTFTSALTFELEEDFSDNDLSGWEVSKLASVGFNLTKTYLHDWSFTDGYIQSLGDGYLPFTFNSLVHEINTVYGVFQVDVNYPASRASTNFDWYIWLTDNYYGGIENDPFDYRITARTRNGTYVALSPAKIDVETKKLGTQEHLYGFVIENPPTTQVWAHYDFVRTPDSFLIAIDNVVVANFTYSDSVSQYGHFSLLSNIATLVKFDNIRISPNYDEYLAALPPPSQTASSSSSESDSPAPALYLNLFSILVIAVLGSRLYKKYY